MWKIEFNVGNVWSIKIRTTHNLSLWLYEYFWIILLYGHLVYFILKVLAWEISNMKWGFTKKVIIKSQKQFMYGSNFHGSDVNIKRSYSLIYILCLDKTLSENNRMIKNTFNVWHMILFLLFLIQYIDQLHKKPKKRNSLRVSNLCYRVVTIVNPTVVKGQINS